MNDTFEAVSDRLANVGFAHADASPDRIAVRGAERLRTVSSPWSLTFELVLELVPSVDDFVSPFVTGGFQTDGVEVGHTALAVLDYQESERFLIDGLEMVQSDWIETEFMAGVELEVRFYHCNSRHHSIALAKVPFDLGTFLHHFQIEVNERDDVGFAFDRAWNADWTLQMALACTTTTTPTVLVFPRLLGSF